MIRRRLLGFLSLFSLLVSIGLLAFWIDSYGKARWLYFTPGRGTEVNYGLVLSRGVLRADKWVDGHMHGIMVKADGWNSARRGSWDWGSAELSESGATAFFFMSVTEMGSGGPTATIGPFGWGTTEFEKDVVIFGHWGRRPAVPGPPAVSVRTSAFVPIWALFVLALLPPLLLLSGLAWTAYRHRRTLRTGHCTNCGYDLRGSTETCPECGAVIPARPSAEPTSAELARRLERIEWDS